LTISWKLYDDVIIHTDVLETSASGETGGAVGKDRKILKVNDKNFEDLDEIIYRYIIPIVEKSKEITGFKYFKNDDKKRYGKEIENRERERTK